MATTQKDSRDELQRQLGALWIKEQKAELRERGVLLWLFVGVTMVAAAVALVGVITDHPFAGLATSSVLTTTATVLIWWRRLGSRRRK
jgi:hypothetical protein